MPPIDEIDTEDSVEIELDAPKIVDEAGAPEGAEKPAKAESSPAADDSKPEEPDTLSIVRDVVAGKKPGEAAASSAESEVPGATKAPAETKEPDDENYSDVPFNKHPRFQQVLTKLKTAEVDAVRYRNVETFISNQGLAPEEAADLLTIGGLIKTDPVEAWKRMKPVVQQVLTAAGEVLPDDLKAMVQNGDMTREAAMEVSRSRAMVQSTQVRSQWQVQRDQAERQAAMQRGIQDSVSSWEAERRQRDPNFESKLPAIEREVAWLQTRDGRPNTAEGVRAQLQKAYDAVSAAYVAPVQRQRPAVRPVTGGQVNGNVRPEIKDTMDVVQSVLARRAG